MAHAGTMDLGRSARAKKSGSRLPVVALTLAVVATIAVVVLASSAGLMGRSAKPAADRALDGIEAQRGAVTLPSVPIQSREDYLNRILDGAHAAPFAAAPFAGETATLPSDRQWARDIYLNNILNGAHAAPYRGDTVTGPVISTPSHPGKDADDVLAPAPIQRERFGGQ